MGIASRAGGVGSRGRRKAQCAADRGPDGGGDLPPGKVAAHRDGALERVTGGGAARTTLEVGFDSRTGRLVDLRRGVGRQLCLQLRASKVGALSFQGGSFL